MFEEAVFISDCKSNWPALDRTAYLIEHTCVPQYVPSYCAEAGQLFAAMADCLRRGTLPENEGGK